MRARYADDTRNGESSSPGSGADAVVRSWRSVQHELGPGTSLLRRGSSRETDPAPTATSARSSATTLAMHGRPAVERDEREDVRRSLREHALAAVDDRERVDLARAREGAPLLDRAVARDAVAARRPHVVVAVHAPRHATSPRSSASKNGTSSGFSARSTPGRSRHDALTSTLVADIARDPSEKPEPCTTASSHDGTCSSGCASPRSCRTASIVRIMPPRMSGWLFDSPPPSVLSGSTPFGDMQRAVAHEPAALALRAEPEVLEREQHGDGEES